jgi:AcrR family transcriptional regulator
MPRRARPHAPFTWAKMQVCERDGQRGTKPMTNVDTNPAGAGVEGPGEGSATRRRILQIALSLMSQRGVDGTSMRDLASAAGLNVASLYHYFPSKRDLLESVLAEQGFMPDRAGEPEVDIALVGGSTLAQLIADIIVSMIKVEDFVRLMVGEAIRGDHTARTVGFDLFTAFESAIADWISTQRPDLTERMSADEIARLLCAMVVGLFVQYAAGVMSELSEADLTTLALERASEAARIIEAGSGPSS